MVRTPCGDGNVRENWGKKNGTNQRKVHIPAHKQTNSSYTVTSYSIKMMIQMEQRHDR